MSATLERMGLAFLERHPDRAASVLESIPPQACADFFTKVAPGPAGRVLLQMTPNQARGLMAGLPVERLVEIVSGLSVLTGSSILRLLDSEAQSKVLQRLESAERKALTRALVFPPDSVGSLMDPFHPAFPSDLDVGTLRARLQEDPTRACFCVFTLNRAQRPIGVISTHQIFLSRGDQPASAIAVPCRNPLRSSVDWREIFEDPELHHWNALPVIDGDGRYLGAFKTDAIPTQREEGTFPQDQERWRRTGSALGEVYRIGLAGMVEAIENARGKRP